MSKNKDNKIKDMDRIRPILEAFQKECVEKRDYTAGEMSRIAEEKRIAKEKAEEEKLNKNYVHKELRGVNQIHRLGK